MTNPCEGFPFPETGCAKIALGTMLFNHGFPDTPPQRMRRIQPENEVTQWGISDRSEFKKGRIISFIRTFLRSGMTLESKFTQCTVHNTSIFHKKSTS